MDLNIAQLRALFEPFDLPHLLRLWAVLTLFIFLWGLMIATCGGYATPKRFWRIHIGVIGSVLLLSGAAFLIFYVDPLFLILSFSALAFVIQGDLAANFRYRPPKERWFFRFGRRQREAQKVSLDAFRRIERK